MTSSRTRSMPLSVGVVCFAAVAFELVACGASAPRAASSSALVASEPPHDEALQQTDAADAEAARIEAIAVPTPSGPVRLDDGGYPLQWRMLSVEERAAIEAYVIAVSPGFTGVRIDPLGFIAAADSGAGFVPGNPAEHEYDMRAGEAAVRRFAELHASRLGLPVGWTVAPQDDMAPRRWQIVQSVAGGTLSMSFIPRYDGSVQVSGHLWGNITLPSGERDDRTLMAAYVGAPVTVHRNLEVRCDPIRGHPCPRRNPPPEVVPLAFEQLEVRSTLLITPHADTRIASGNLAAFATFARVDTHDGPGQIRTSVQLITDAPINQLLDRYTGAPLDDLQTQFRMVPVCDLFRALPAM